MLRVRIFKSFTFLLSPHRHIQTSTTTNTIQFAPQLQSPNPIKPVNESHLLRVCTILYQQQHSSDQKLHNNLKKTSFDLTHEFFLQVCNKFHYSWRPIYKFYQFTKTQPQFTHTPTTFNKMLDVIGKSRNIDLFWEVLQETGKYQLVTPKTYIVGVKTLALARELKKCVEVFHLMNGFGYVYSVDVLNKVVEVLCRSKLVEEAEHVVVKLKDWIKPNGVTYKWLIYGFCDVGDMIEGSKIWNLMVDEGFEPDIASVEIMMETLFKNNKYVEALKIFQSVRVNRMSELGVETYRLVINWLCKKGKLGGSYVVFEEMQNRGIKPDNFILGSIMYGLMSRGRVMEAYRVVEGIEKPEISVYHGMIKGLLKLKRASEATRVFREMINRGCEPIMHTYVMLLQGHLGKRGRKGSDPLVNFDTIFVGGLVKAGKTLEANKYAERLLYRNVEVPRFDYNKFLHYYSNEEGVVMFDVMSKKLREVGHFDLADIFARYGEKMATRDRRRIRKTES
ncbi:putative pentatricopeptide repeat-containing protein At1g26500 [Lycium ferocissimum]|uniref:putative pentatricopeptide repeat-containing protein At1g26500 n=1 Tax=Lycium ferocissimum TaxID=112874 RepID=UPI0028152E9D|nr:putative pentatricopeptide repeat-containing protein At1g26500 [Lycium ferocissimum]